MGDFKDQKIYIKGVIANLKAMKKAVGTMKDPRNLDDLEFRREYIMRHYDIGTTDKSFKSDIREYIEDALRFQGVLPGTDLMAVQGGQRGHSPLKDSCRPRNVHVGVDRQDIQECIRV